MKPVGLPPTLRQNQAPAPSPNIFPEYMILCNFYINSISLTSLGAKHFHSPSRDPLSPLPFRVQKDCPCTAHLIVVSCQLINKGAEAWKDCRHLALHPDVLISSLAFLSLSRAPANKALREWRCWKGKNPERSLSALKHKLEDKLKRWQKYNTVTD